MTMNEEYYKYKPEDAERFKTAIGARAKVIGSEMEFLLCPYCHGGAHLDKGTFSINTETGQFQCQRASCGAKGNMITLAKDFADVFSLGSDVNIYYDINGTKNQFLGFRDAHRKIETRDPAIEYMKSRGIPEEITKKYEITTKENEPNILCFPFRDENGEVVFVKYRNINFVKGETPGSKEWCIKGNYKKILFGMYQCEDFGTLVITEGQLDSLSCAAAGVKNAVSVPTGKNGFTWKPNVWNWLVKFEEIVVFGDREGDKITLAEQITQFFPKRVRIVKPSSYQGCKDANEMLQKIGPVSIQKAIEDAEVQVNLRIKNLAEVENIDLSKMVFYPTGIKSLDNKIGNGFHDGELIILTGKCGEGKSTFASQIAAKMIQNGLKVFCYSGELPDYMFKAWIDKQICNGANTEAARNAASAFYDKKCYIYDNSSVIDEKEEVFSLIAQAIKSLGCKFILIDNLMTAMETKPLEDLYRQQAAFVTKLTKYAKGFNSIIMLVAHPKKGDSDDNDSISGSGDITNRANLVLRYQRESKKEEDNNKSRIKITKNRTTGRLDWDGIEVEYEPISMRIHEPGEEIESFLELTEEADWIQADGDLEDIPF